VAFLGKEQFLLPDVEKRSRANLCGRGSMIYVEGGLCLRRKGGLATVSSRGVPEEKGGTTLALKKGLIESPFKKEEKSCLNQKPRGKRQQIHGRVGGQVLPPQRKQERGGKKKGLTIHILRTESEVVFREGESRSCVRL